MLVCLKNKNKKSEDTDQIVFSTWYILESLECLMLSAQSNYCKVVSVDLSARTSLIKAQHFKAGKNQGYFMSQINEKLVHMQKLLSERLHKRSHPHYLITFQNHGKKMWLMVSLSLVADFYYAKSSQKTKQIMHPQEV